MIHISKVLLLTEDLRTHFYTYHGVVKALDGVDLTINEGEAVGLVGETGCGKTVTALSILRLIKPPGRIESGRIIFKGENLMEKSIEEMRKIRGREISMIFQDPISSLDPLFTVGDQICEVMMYRKVSKEEAKKRAIEMLQMVGMPNPEGTMNRYPHELSGGMAQRVNIASALLGHPDLLITDEPTTALDATIQAQILELIEELRAKTKASVLLITHNFGIVCQICEKVAVMYAGNVVEFGDIISVFKRHRHPYTLKLFRSIPKVTEEKRDLEVINGTVPTLIDPPEGCRFHPRCPYVKEICTRQKPKLTNLRKGHTVACFLYTDEVKQA